MQIQTPYLCTSFLSQLAITLPNAATPTMVAHNVSGEECANEHSSMGKGERVFFPRIGKQGQF